MVPTTRTIRNSPGLLFTGAIPASGQVDSDCIVPEGGALKVRVKSDQNGNATIYRVDPLGNENSETSQAITAGTESSIEVADPMPTPHFVRLTNTGSSDTTPSLTLIEAAVIR